MSDGLSLVDAANCDIIMMLQSLCFNEAMPGLSQECVLLFSSYLIWEVLVNWLEHINIKAKQLVLQQVERIEFQRTTK